MKYFAQVSNNEYEVDLYVNNDEFTIQVNGKRQKVEFVNINETILSLLIGNRAYEIAAKRETNGYVVSIDNKKFFVSVEDEKKRIVKSLLKSDIEKKGTTQIIAPMPGLIMKVSVSEGETVKKGDGLFIIEAMKMENEIRAAEDGVVRKIHVNEGQSVDKGAVILIVE